MAANTPFRRWKTDANSEGGTRNPLILFYPKVIKDKGGIRNQYSHIMDIFPTTLELAGLALPEFIHGVKQDSVEGISLAYSVQDAKAPSRHTIQYYEVLGSRSVYKDGWKAGALHVKGQDFSKDKWELYNLNEDYNERFDLAEKNPAKLKELQEVFEQEAKKYNVYPLKDGSVPTVGPSQFDGKSHIVFYPGLSSIVELAAPKLTNRSYDISADIEVPAKGSEGVLLSTGGRAGGISLFVQNNKPVFVYNTGVEKFTIQADQALGPGRSTVKLVFGFEEKKPNSSATASLYINDKKVGEGKIGRTVTAIFSHEGLNVGLDDLTTVADTYKAPFAYTGILHKVTLDLH
jgi:arylsulfatase